MFGSRASSNCPQHSKTGASTSSVSVGVVFAFAMSLPPLLRLLLDDEPGAAANQLLRLQRAATHRATPEALDDRLGLPAERVRARLRRGSDLPLADDRLRVLVLCVSREQIGLAGTFRGAGHELAFDEVHGVDRVATGTLRLSFEVPERVRVEEVLDQVLGTGEHQSLFDLDRGSGFNSHLRSPPPLPAGPAGSWTCRPGGRTPARYRCPPASSST